METSPPDSRGFLSALVGDGRPLLALTGLALVFSGAFAMFLSARGEFLPHDVLFLGMRAEDLCALHGCRVVHFMFHDRVSFGGAIAAVGILYLWLAEFALKEGEAWAWWAFLISGGLGFGSFLSYLGYGYLDSWHGMATLALLPFFIVGLARSAKGVTTRVALGERWRALRETDWKTRGGLGRALLLATSAGMTLAGASILVLGSTAVFVPQDLKFMGVTVEELRGFNARLVPLIAHDRAGFGGGLCVCGVLVGFCVVCGSPSKSLWQALFLAGTIGFLTAVGVHPIIGYTDVTHLAPAVVGACLFVAGIALSYRPMTRLGRWT